jgi:hypothetical protein
MENLQLAYKDNLTFGDVIVVYNPRSLLHKAIAFITGKKRYKAGHVAMSYYGNIVESASKGVDVKQYKDYSPYHHIYVMRIRERITQEQIDLMQQYISNAIGTKYSFFQLPVIALKYIFHLPRTLDISRSAVICSEFLADCYRFAGIKISRKIPADTAPIDFLSSNKFQLVFMYKPGLVTRFVI